MKNKGIYIHIPFCVRKCLYCDFYSVSDKSLYKVYVRALKAEIEEYKGTFADTVFIGGGTPTVLGDLLLDVIRAVTENFILSDNCEFTVEANPGTVTKELLYKMRKLGVNRLSIGGQSFNDNELKALGRIHSAEEIKSAFYMARNAGFDNINIDIMLSTPLQTLESVKHTLDEVKILNPEHVSAYSLIVEEGTPFYHMDLELPDEDTEREIYYYAVDFLKSIGLERYEISNFSKGGFESLHNIKYWTGKDYIGLGCGAHSYNENKRFANISNVKDYIDKPIWHIDEVYIDEEEKMKEKFLLGLRMSKGVEYSGEFPSIIEKLKMEGLIEVKDNFVKLTEKGFDLGNQVFMEFI